MAIIEKTGVFTYLDSDGNEVRLYPKSKNEIADAVISVLSSDWALDETTGMYKQDFTVNGITSESVPVIGLVPTGIPTPDSEAEAYSHITDAVTGDNTLTLYADEALTTAITIIVKGISATGGSTVADISNLTAAYNELNSNLTNESDEQFVFGVKDGVRGFYTNPSRADDCFIPFKSMDVYYISSDGLPNPNPLKYTFTKNSQEGYVLLYGARTLYGSPVIFTVSNNKCNYEILDTYNSTIYEGHGILLKLTDIKKDGFIQIQTDWEVGGIFFVIY